MPAGSPLPGLSVVLGTTRLLGWETSSSQLQTTYQRGSAAKWVHPVYEDKFLRTKISMSLDKQYMTGLTNLSRAMLMIASLPSAVSASITSASVASSSRL